MSKRFDDKHSQRIASARNIRLPEVLLTFPSKISKSKTLLTDIAQGEFFWFYLFIHPCSFGIFFKLRFFTRLKIVVCRKISETTIVIIALTILQTFQLYLTWLLFFRLLNLHTCIRNICHAFNLIQDIELQAPDNIRCILDIPRLLETLKTYGQGVARSI